MSNELMQVFSYGSTQIRTVIHNDEPWFCAKDVCVVLGYITESGNVSSTVKTHCKLEGRMTYTTPTTSGNQEMLYINERNLYRLIMRSKLESAEKFQDWVEGEVLPTIRKTGSYQPSTAPSINSLDTLKLIVNQFEHQEKHIQEVKAIAEEARDIAIANTPKNITNSQQLAIRNTISEMVKGSGGNLTFPMIYNKLYTRFDIPRYQELGKDQFDEAIAYICSMRPGNMAWQMEL